MCIKWVYKEGTANAPRPPPASRPLLKPDCDLRLAPRRMAEATQLLPRLLEAKELGKAAVAVCKRREAKLSKCKSVVAIIILLNTIKSNIACTERMISAEQCSGAAQGAARLFRQHLRSMTQPMEPQEPQEPWQPWSPHGQLVNLCETSCSQHACASECESHLSQPRQQLVAAVAPTPIAAPGARRAFEQMQAVWHNLLTHSLCSETFCQSNQSNAMGIHS